MTSIPPYVEIKEANEYKEIIKMPKEDIIERAWKKGKETETLLNEILWTEIMMGIIIIMETIALLLIVLR